MVHPISWAIVQGNDVLDSAGNPSTKVALRSCGKPFQLEAMIESGALGGLIADSDAVALMGSSHNGEAKHVEKVLEILAERGLSEADLLCGTHEPYRSWVSRRQASTNCSGKHAAMLSTTLHFGWEASTYPLLDHPTQQLIADGLRRRFPDTSSVAVDGCGAPTFITTLQDVARGYSALAAGQSVALATIRDADIASADFLGGTDRHETHLNPRYGVVVKPGSDGLWSAAIPAQSIGISVKAHSGDENASAVAGVTLLQRLGVLNIENDSEIRRLLTWTVTTNLGEPAGRIDVVL